MTIIYFVSTLVIKQALKIRWNVVIYYADEKKSFLVFVVYKSRYRDTHSEDTISNMWDIDYLFFVWSC